MTIHVDARDCRPAIEPAHKGSLAELVKHAVARWRNRNTGRTLLELDDHMLADIGVSRGDVVQMLATGDADPAGSLGRLSERRPRRH